ncbi:MAG: PspA/IM30 family protein [Myxococcota bacterium]
MTRQPRRGPLARLHNLISALFSAWVRDRENESPRAVYEQAIAQRIEQYQGLKEAVAGILYLRTKLEGEIGDRRAELARLHDDLKRAVRREDDELSLTLVAHKQRLVEDVERAEGELRTLRTEAEGAKENLLRFREEIRHLEREKGRALALVAGAQARRRVRTALEGLSVDADVRALEGVREHISRLASEAHLDRELAQAGEMPTRLREIREEARQEAARRELEEIKRSVHSRELPAPAQVAVS